MSQLRRPLTLSFPTRGLGRLTESEIVNVLAERINTSDIKAVQLTEDQCRVTVANEAVKHVLATSRLRMKGRDVILSDACRPVTNVTVKDAPYEMPDVAVTSALSAYGEVVQGSLRRGKVKGTNIESGTRYLALYDAKEVVPTTVTVGVFDLRVLCDNNRTECKHCSLTSHPHYSCPARPSTQKACFRCFSTSHMVQDCTNDVVCRFCGRTGHTERQCEEKQEKVERERYGEYYHEIREGRDTTAAKEEDVFPPAKQTNEKKKANQLAKDSHQKEEVQPSTPVSTNSTVDEQTRRTVQTLILGASNMKNIDSPPGVHIQAESGATLLSVQSLIGAAGKQTDISEVKTVVIHLGTNDVTRQQGAEIMLNASAAVTKVEKKFPHADIALCAVPPRKGTERSQKNANDATLATNSYLQAMCRRSSKLVYIDTYPQLAPKGHPVRSLYSNTDPSGVHYSMAGKNEVLSCIMATLLVREDASLASEQHSTKRKPSASPSGASDHHKKKPQLHIFPSGSSDIDAAGSEDESSSESTAQAGVQH